MKMYYLNQGFNIPTPTVKGVQLGHFVFRKLKVKNLHMEKILEESRQLLEPNRAQITLTFVRGILVGTSFFVGDI